MLLFEEEKEVEKGKGRKCGGGGDLKDLKSVPRRRYERKE